MAAASLGAITSTPFLNPLNTKQHHQLQQQEMTRQQQMALWQLMISRASQQQQQSQLIQHKATSPLSPPVRYTTTTQPTLYSINISEVERLRQVSPKKEGQQKKAEESPKSAKGSGSNFSIEFILKKEETDVSKSPRQSPATPISPSSGAFQLPKAFIYTPPQKYEQGKKHTHIVWYIHRLCCQTFSHTHTHTHTHTRTHTHTHTESCKPSLSQTNVSSIGC